MQKFNLQKERDYLANLTNAQKRPLSEEEEWKLSDNLAKPLKASMIKGLKEDIDLISDAIKDLEKPGEKWNLPNFLSNLQGIAKHISGIEQKAKQHLNYN